MYRVMLVDLIDPHFVPEPPKEIYKSKSFKDCKNFCKTYLKDNGFGFYTLEIQKQVMSWEKVSSFF